MTSLTTVLKEYRREQTGLKQRRRAERESDLAAKQIARGEFGVVYLPHPRDMPADRLIAKDAVLFLQTSPSMVPASLKAMSDWGFTYKSQLALRKDEEQGDWFRIRHALVLVGTRGKVPAPAPGTQSASVIEGLALYELIERYFPNMPKMSAGEPRPGWGCGG
jgi:N6-adenosine-specific RNA methylase IME4